MSKRLFVAAAISSVLLLGLVGVVAFKWGGLNSVGADRQGPPIAGPIDRDGAVKNALWAARVQGFEVKEAYAQMMTRQDWAATTGASLGEALRPERQVWVVVFLVNETVNRGIGPSWTFDNYEVALDKETGELLGEGNRKPGAQPPFPLNSDTKVPIQ